MLVYLQLLSLHRVFRRFVMSKLREVRGLSG